jgi:hypothetical protein
LDGDPAVIERRLNVSLTDPGASEQGGYLKRLIGFGGRERVLPAPVIGIPEGTMDVMKPPLPH